MRLLHTTKLRLQEFPGGDVPRYAILSHMWGEGEITYQDIKEHTFAQMNAFPKLQGCCKRAAEDGYEWVWIDTCCIDKTSSAELSEAINSMYQWYRDSDVCYAYLEDIASISKLSASRWFTRGWTLQEFIAPRRLLVFDFQWRELGSKNTLVDQIFHATGIPKEIISGMSPLQCNVAQRMSWASSRQTTREEDMAYCLMGLFDVHMPPIYGEGAEKAFIRLEEEILKRSSDQTLFLWTSAHDPYNQGLLATSPRAFCTHYNCFHWMVDAMRIPHSAMKKLIWSMAGDTFQIDLEPCGGDYGQNHNLDLCCFLR
ncbi:HET-domain-containing protein [Mollisia scopiformis]|uniref:HET-domain-containing protein n=1 Tax=Mollisia scopiformis TaxID=149040 RepID=A0A194X152_MOLSC|nr:HET-domain-containing protein [Mollisia scopiformis]KUJ13699.1 HET-domain-containing protein [Mollisia scopiformis]